MEILFSAAKNEDGWDNLSNQNYEDASSYNTHKDTNARNVLNKQYSLQPDMITGWMPKLPSCPIPLTYNNRNIKQVCHSIAKDNKYHIVYRGVRCINSVQLHRKYSYNWRYRERYDMKINVIEDAIENVGKPLPNLDQFNMQKQICNRQDILAFDSDFESGNLDLAIRVKKDQFDCFIRSDTNTNGHTNWYYFKVSNRHQLGTVQFNICNIVKVKNLYGKGMTPYTRIVLTGQSQSQWSQKQCYDVQFVQRISRYSNSQKTHNQLQFKFDFTEQDMQVYFAYSIPYTYSDLQTYIQSIRVHPQIKITRFCESFSGLQLPLITISQNEQVKKIAAVVIARIHPGQTNSSFLMEGFINSLLYKNQADNSLLSSCNLYVVPMINPDGVVSGNYRTSFSGRDLNRKFDQVGRFLYPEINGLVRLVHKLKQQHHKVEFFLDFHSHSSKKGLFCYGPQHHKDSVNYVRSRLFVKMLSKKDHMFNTDECIYSISKYKKFAARSYMLQTQNIPMTYTFQVSNGIYLLADNQYATYDRESLLRAGNIIFQGFCEYARYHLAEIDHQIKNIKKQSISRLSVRKHKNSKLARKSLNNVNSQGLILHDQYLSCKNQKIKSMIAQVMQHNQPQEQQLEEHFSDNQQSDHDIAEPQLVKIFDVRKKYDSVIKSLISHRFKGQKPSHKTSLKNISNQIVIKRTERPNSAAVIKKKPEQKVQISSSLTKHRKIRIYYQQTHPPNAKKITESTNYPKKAIKQRKFPIIF